MPSITPPNQRVFIVGKEAVDNAYIVHEIIHFFLTNDKKLNQGHPCIALKLDMSKAYDRIS